MHFFFLGCNSEELFGRIYGYEYDVAGTVMILDSQTLKINGFNYNGLGPDAFFYLGTSGTAGPNGIRLDFPADRPNQKLGRFQNRDVIIKLPVGLSAENITWFSVWCRRFGVNFGEVYKATPRA